MTKRERFIIGGIGGLAPVLMFVLNGSLQESLTGSYVLIAIGFLVRMVILFLVGGFVVSLYPEVTQRFKVFQLGLSAPAMIAGLMAASSNAPSLYAIQKSPGMVLIPVVHAQTVAPKTADLKHFTLPAPGPLSQLVRGLTSYQPIPSNVWFVIAGSFPSVDNAWAYAKQINDKYPGFHANVYAPYANDPNYSVVIGAQLTQQDAKVLRDKAVSVGMTKDTNYKTFPNLPLPPSPQ